MERQMLGGRNLNSIHLLHFPTFKSSSNCHEIGVRPDQERRVDIQKTYGCLLAQEQLEEKEPPPDTK
jgi:hypothetical protein